MNQVPINSYAGIYYRRIMSYMKKAFKLIGLTFEEGVILQNVLLNPNTNQDQIAKALAFDTAAVARALKELEEKKYITRKIDINNQRKKIVEISKKGEEIALKVNMIMENWDQEIFKDMNNTKANKVIDNMRLLKESTDNLDINDLVNKLK